MKGALRAWTWLALVFVLVAPASARDRPVSADYGKVIIDNFSSHQGMAAVRFDHWFHRSKFTCRVCHGDIGFSMEANGTKITAETNMRGFYCGSCHNGRSVDDGESIFPACSTIPNLRGGKVCARCHSVGNNIRENRDYLSFTRNLPKARGEDLVDWEEAEARGLVKPADTLPGTPGKDRALRAQEDFSIRSKGWMPNIIFSHKKHALWNSCEACHPEIFPSVKRGAVKYSMFEIFDGEYCGLCHDRVAFPLSECEKCHTDNVRK